MSAMFTGERKGGSVVALSEERKDALGTCLVYPPSRRIGELPADEALVEVILEHQRESVPFRGYLRDPGAHRERHQANPACDQSHRPPDALSSHAVDSLAPGTVKTTRLGPAPPAKPAVPTQRPCSRDTRNPLDPGAFLPANHAHFANPARFPTPRFRMVCGIVWLVVANESRLSRERDLGLRSAQRDDSPAAWTDSKKSRRSPSMSETHGDASYWQGRY